MRYFLLRQDARPDGWRVAFTDDLSLDAVRLGLPMVPPARPARVTLASAQTAPSDFLEFPCPFVSDRMRQALDAAGVDNVEYFPALVDEQYGDGGVIAEYWVANVVGAVACASPLGGDVADGPDEVGPPAAPFRVDPARAGGLGLFRLAEDRRLLVVSEPVADVLRAAGLRGVALQPPETYTGRLVASAPNGPAAGTPDPEAEPPAP